MRRHAEHGVEQPREARVDLVAAQRVEPPLALGVRLDEPGVAQHLEVVRERRASDAEVRERAAGAGSVGGQLAHDREPHRVAERMQDRSELRFDHRRNKREAASFISIIVEINARGKHAEENSHSRSVFATLTALAWGGQFVVGKSALGSVNAFPLSTIRYAVAAALWLVVLAAVEGRGALRLDGRGRRLFWLGTLGFAGFNLLAYTGLAHARPQSASLIVALGPLLTALVLWRRTRVRPTATTLVLLGIALLGVALVISGGHPASLVDGSVGWGDALVLGGVLSFVLYSLGAAEFPSFSPLRYTALTAGLGWLSLAAATSVALAAGLVPLPSATTSGRSRRRSPTSRSRARSSPCSRGTPRSRSSARRTRCCSET